MEDKLAVLKAFPAASDYLSHMYMLQRDYGFINNQRIAQRMGVSGSAVTQASGRLKRLGLISQKPYGKLFLSAEGYEIAAIILKRHYLLEHMLIGKLNFPWDKADTEAHILQNYISDELTAHLDFLLNYPQTCPHGNPLPGCPCEAELLALPRLGELRTENHIHIRRITEEGEAIPEMLPFCHEHGVMPEARFWVYWQESQVYLQDEKKSRNRFAVPGELAAHIGVQID